DRMSASLWVSVGLAVTATVIALVHLPRHETQAHARQLMASGSTLNTRTSALAAHPCETCLSGHRLLPPRPWGCSRITGPPGGSHEFAIVEAGDERGNDERDRPGRVWIGA